MLYSSGNLLFVKSGVAYPAQISSYIEVFAASYNLPSDHYIRVVTDQQGYYRNRSFLYVKNEDLARKLVEQSESQPLIQDKNQSAYIRIMSRRKDGGHLTLRFNFAEVEVKEPTTYDLHVLRVSGLNKLTNIEAHEQRLIDLATKFSFFSSSDKVSVKGTLGEDNVYIFFDVGSTDAIFARTCMQYENFQDSILHIHLAYKWKKKEEYRSNFFGERESHHDNFTRRRDQNSSDKVREKSYKPWRKDEIIRFSNKSLDHLNRYLLLTQV